MRIFVGYDENESIGFHVCTQSLIRNSSKPVSITALGGNKRDGSNNFTYDRFLVPYLCDFKGWALWIDGADMLVLGDVNEIKPPELGCAVYVVKHDYKTKHPRKYVGTSIEADNSDYPRKNWSSVILWDCGHYMNKWLYPSFINEHDGSYLHRFGWLPDERVGELPIEWNWLADEYGENEEAKILHWTAGIPGFTHYAHTPHAPLWRQYARHVVRGLA